MLITIPLTLENMHHFIIKPWRKFEGLCFQKNQKQEKLQIFLKNA